MFKKLIFIFIITFMVCIISQPVLTYAKNHHQFVNKVRIKLTKEQRRLLREKQEEFKNEYLKDYDKMTPEEKKIAIEKFKDAMKKFIKEEFGIVIDDETLSNLNNTYDIKYVITK